MRTKYSIALTLIFLISQKAYVRRATAYSVSIKKVRSNTARICVTHECIHNSSRARIECALYHAASQPERIALAWTWIMRGLSVTRRRDWRAHAGYERANAPVRGRNSPFPRTRTDLLRSIASTCADLRHACSRGGVKHYHRHHHHASMCTTMLLVANNCVRCAAFQMTRLWKVHALGVASAAPGSSSRTASFLRGCSETGSTHM